MYLYFKIPVETALGCQFAEEHKRLRQCREKTETFVKLYGEGSTKYLPADNYGCGVRAIQFENMDKVPFGWISYTRRRHGPCLYKPSGTHHGGVRDVYKYMQSLPLYRPDNLHRLIGFTEGYGDPVDGGRQWFHTFNTYFVNGCFFIEIEHRCGFTRLPDMVEITGTEFLSRVKSIENAVS